MSKMRWVGLAALFTAACGSSDPVADIAPETTPGALRVYTVSYPLQYFAERIGGEHVDAVFPAPREVDPAFWNPGPEDVGAYQEADRILLNGAGYAKWVATVTLPTSKVVDTSAGFRDRYIIREDALVHSHGPEGEHSHAETASTTWLDPALAVEQAAAIRDALIAARPENASAFHEGFAALARDLEALDERFEAAITGGGEVKVVASHPVYPYFARRYGVHLPSVQFEPSEYPDDDGWHDLEHVVEEHPAAWMLWEDEPLSRTAERLRRMGIESVVLDPCAHRPDSGDFLSVMDANARRIEAVFSTPSDR